MQFFKSIATLFPRFAPRPGALERAVKTSPKTRRLRLEPLENRELLAVDAFAAAFGPPSLENVANEASPAVVSASVLADDRATLSVRTETPTPVVVPSFEQLMESLGMVEIESLDALDADDDAEKSPESNATQTELQPSFIVDGVAYYPLSQATPRRVVFEGSDVDVASLDEPFVIVPNANADGESVYGAQSGGSGGEGEPDVWTLDFTGEVTTLLGGLTAVGIENALLERATTVSGGASFGSGGASGGAASGGGDVEIESLAPNYLQVTLPELPYAYEATVTFGGEALLGVDYEIHAPLHIFNQYYNAQSFVYSGGSTDFYVLPVNDGAPEPLENFTATLATPTPTVDSGGSSYAQPYEFTFATSETVSATFVDDDHWQVSVEASDPTATERLADVEQDYGYYTFKREHQNPYVAEKIDAKVQELTEANATEAAIGAVQALAALVTGDTTYGVTVDFEALYNRESTYDAQPTVDYALTTSPLASESASSYLSSFTFSSTPNQSEDPLWRYDCSGVIPQWRTEALLRLNPTFDWLDEGELFDPNYLIDADLDAATPDEQLGEKARLRLLDATWSGQGAEYDPLAETLAEVEIKDGALAELYFDYDGDGTLDPYQSTDDETCYVPLNNDDDNENDVEDRLETALVANENDLISALAVAWLDTLTCLTDGVYYVIDAFLNFAGTAISVFEDPDGTDPYAPTDANGNQTPIFVSSPTSPTYAAPVYLEGTDFGAAGATLDPDVSRVTEGDATSNDDDIKTPTNLGPVVDKPIMSTPYKVDLDVDSDNSGDYFMPEHSDWEETLEEAKYGLGKIITVNSGDVDNDNILDCWDGYGSSQNYSQMNPNSSARFTPITITLPDDCDISEVYINLNYSSTPPGPLPSNLSLPSSNGYGTIRLWKKDGPQARWVSDDYITPNYSYSATSLGFSESVKTVTLYIEGITPSKNVQSLMDIMDWDGFRDYSTIKVDVNVKQNSQDVTVATDTVNYVVDKTVTTFLHKYQTNEVVRAALAAKQIYDYVGEEKYTLNLLKKDELEKLLPNDNPDLTSARSEAIDLLTQREKNPDGFVCGLYHDYVSNKYILAFAGTQDYDIADIYTDITQALGLFSGQYNYAITLAATLANLGLDYIITGHSLGGGLASAAACASGKTTYTFNAAGLHRSTLENYLPSSGADQEYNVSKEQLLARYENSASFVNAYYVDFDLLSIVQDWSPLPNAIGNRIGLDGQYDLEVAFNLLSLTPTPASGLVKIIRAAKLLEPTIQCHSMEQVLFGLLGSSCYDN